MEFIKPEYLTERDGGNPRARVWKYRLNSDPSKRKVLNFGIPYTEEEVRRYLRGEGIKDITVWPIFMDEPPIVKKPGYGLCPLCGAPGKTRERRLDGNDTCVNGHTYPSKDALIG